MKQDKLESFFFFLPLNTFLLNNTVDVIHDAGYTMPLVQPQQHLDELVKRCHKSDE